MSNFTDILRKEEQKKIFSSYEIEKNLKEMENWSLTENQTLDERHEQERLRILTNLEENKKLQEKTKSSINAFSGNIVQNTASGSPIQTVPPAKVSSKELRKRNKETRNAQKINPNADYRSYRISEQLTELEKGKNNSFSKIEKKQMRKKYRLRS